MQHGGKRGVLQQEVMDSMPSLSFHSQLHNLALLRGECSDLTTGTQYNSSKGISSTDSDSEACAIIEIRENIILMLLLEDG